MYRLAELRRTAALLLEEVDMLCVPSIPTFYSLADLGADTIGTNSRTGSYTNFVNLMDLCAIAVPCSPRNDGRPGSVTLVACTGQDASVAALANVLQRSAVVTLRLNGKTYFLALALLYWSAKW